MLLCTAVITRLFYLGALLSYHVIVCKTKKEGREGVCK